MKVKYKQFKEIDEEFDIRRFYENKYFGIFLSKYRFSNLTRSQNRFLFKKFWQNGTIAAFILEGTKQEPSLKALLTNQDKATIAVGNMNQEEQGLIVFVPYATDHYNIEDEPSVVNFVNLRGAKFIPSTMQKVNVDCVIGWAHSSHAPICAFAKFYIERICDVEETIGMNLFVHKMPRLIVCSPEDKARVQDLMEAIERGEKKLFLDADDVQAIKNVLEAGGSTQYIIDKLYQYKTSLENELLTFLGLNNIPVEKAERLITAEADSNNQVIQDSSDCFINSLEDFRDQVRDVLGFDMGELEVGNPPEEQENMMEEESGEEQDD